MTRYVAHFEVSVHGEEIELTTQDTNSVEGEPEEYKEWSLGDVV